MSKDKGNEIPILQRIDPREVQDIKNMFNLLCVDHSNRINQHLAIKLFRSLGLTLLVESAGFVVDVALGLDVSHESLPPQLTLKDFLLFADLAAPDDVPEGPII
jgi:Ca2+-binding EF-hand superfamily protein